jgi:2'-5' RNA ligase
MAVGERYAVRDWPLHITVMPVFATWSNAAQLAASMGEVASRTAPISAVAGPGELFGPKHDTPVALVDSDGIRALHKTFVEELDIHVPTFRRPDFAGEGFRAHVTATKHGAAEEGQSLELTQLALVDMQPEPGQGRPMVVAVAALGEGAHEVEPNGPWSAPDLRR